MSEQNNTVQTNEKLLQMYEDLLGRAVLAGQLGMQFGGDRDVYTALGYKKTLRYDDFLARYVRQDIAAAIIERPAEETWGGSLEIQDVDKENTQFEDAFNYLYKTHKLRDVFERLDILSQIGRYGVLFLGFNDANTRLDLQQEVQVSDNLKLLYLRPLSEASALINTWQRDPNDSRFGMPLTYNVKISNPGSNNSEIITVHHSRVIHVAGKQLEDEIDGVPTLEVVFNRLMDLEKLIGSSAEMFWNGAFPGKHASVKEGYQKQKGMEEDLQTQFDEYIHRLRRTLITEGVDIKDFATQVSDPSKHVDVQIQMISAITRIPKRILVGSERGELSSAQDSDEYLKYISNRREKLAETQIVRPFVDKMIAYKLLPTPAEGDYDVLWEDLYSRSENQKATTGKVRAEALKLYVEAIGVQEVMPVDKFLDYVLGLSQEQITDIMNSLNEGFGEDMRSNTEEEEEEENV